MTALNTRPATMHHELDLEAWEGWLDHARDAKSRCQQAHAILTTVLASLDHGQVLPQANIHVVLGLTRDLLDQLCGDWKEMVQFLNHFQPQEED